MASDRREQADITFPSLQGRSRFTEEAVIKNWFSHLPLAKDDRVLDVACGFGRKSEWLRACGRPVDGVDINAESIAIARSKGFQVFTLEEFKRTDHQYRAMLMSHIIEHFSPDALLAFVDEYLDRLMPGGFVAMLSPLEWSNFNDDFDHVKVYQPGAMVAVLCDNELQVQYRARNRLELVDIRIRREPRTRPRHAELYERFHPENAIWKLRYGVPDVVRRASFRLSQGVLGGETVGWMGLFRKR